ncbi:Cation-transporting P-type ATPase [Carpediemonas membranifera]|uniref:Cation-transporting P-type ATPase n=1 Tax=Carpediemonas membranifera TaxID=201153 RepID=A0A8J6B6S3_9EUKA|nr:Cation-transporting P-type ATPase [Carpediemonas membranifera]|eukprot:KAG9396843.1 Cation-transporting P-type ATPase [Carpediemonas membranifera]
MTDERDNPDDTPKRSLSLDYTRRSQDDDDSRRHARSLEANIRPVLDIEDPELQRKKDRLDNQVRPRKSLDGDTLRASAFQRESIRIQRLLDLKFHGNDEDMPPSIPEEVEAPTKTKTSILRKIPIVKKFIPGKAPVDARQAELRKDLEMDEHTVPLEELEKRFESDFVRGLHKADRAERLKRDGKNRLTPPHQTPAIVKFLKCMTGIFSLLLWFGAFLSFLAYFAPFLIEAISKLTDADTGDWKTIVWEPIKAGWNEADINNVYIGVVLSFVVIATGIFSFYQEGKSSKIMNGFKSMIPTIATVYEDGEKIKANAEDLVVGDVIDVEAGMKLPADVRILESHGLKVDNASLTGESEPQSRTATTTHQNPLETQNLAFFGTLMLEGQGRAVVVQCGDNTVMGRIASLTTSTGAESTPINREIHRFVVIISAIAIFLGVTFFIVGVIREPTAIMTNVLFAIGIIVANVPEGLLATVTVGLTLTAQKMRKKMCMVKNLESVETLGSTGCICSDKTGTLTQNKMTVSHLFYDLTVAEAKASYAEGTFSGTYDANNEVYRDLLRDISLCSRSYFDVEDETPNALLRKINGDASETALLRFAHVQHENLAEYRAQYKKLAEIPFNSANKYQASIHAIPDAPDDAPYHHVMVMKGAPERILARCTTIVTANGAVPLDDAASRKIAAAQKEFGSQGERVLGFAQLPLPADQFPRGFEFDSEDPDRFPIDNLQYLGMISMVDPPKEGVPEAVLECKTAGIRTIMVTGDHTVTAKAIAKQVNIITQKTLDEVAEEKGVAEDSLDYSAANAIVIHGDTIRQIDDDGLDRIISSFEEVVFARTSPQQKLLIVESCQRLGYITAVTGDGTNDAAAIKKADIGISMNLTGSDVAKEAADLILLDDSFRSIVTGVKEGRLIFSNLKKSIAYCHRAGTLVRMADMSTMKIEDIKVGDMVLGSMGQPTRVVGLHHKDGDKRPMYEVNYSWGKPAALNTCTEYFCEGHLMHTVRQDTRAHGTARHVFENIPVEDFYNARQQGKQLSRRNPRLASESETVPPANIDKITKLAPEEYFGIEVDADDHLYTLASSIITHNTLSSNIPEITPFLSFIALGIPLPLTTVLILCIDLGTDMIPAISLAYEDPEADIMNLPPRDAKKDRLVTTRLISFSYLQIGIMQAVAGFVTYFYVMRSSGIPWDRIITLFSSHTAELPDTDAYNTIHRRAQTAFFFSIIMVQWADLLICKTRRLSFYSHGLLNNKIMIFGLLFETILGLFIVYFPLLHPVLQTEYLYWDHFLPALPFVFFIFLYDETRKWVIRTFPESIGGVVKRLTYW